MSEHEEILKRYEGKILGVRNYASLKPKKSLPKLNITFYGF